MSLLLLIALFAIAWVVLILPKQRELKRHNALVAAIAVGDEVMTGSGIYGTVLSVDGDTVMLSIAPGTEIKLARRAVAAIVPDPSAAADGSDSDDDDGEPA